MLAWRRAAALSHPAPRAPRGEDEVKLLPLAGVAAPPLLLLL